MKRTLKVLLSIILICLSLFACERITETQHETPSSHEQQEKALYDAYFAEERPFEREWLLDDALSLTIRENCLYLIKIDESGTTLTPVFDVERKISEAFSVKNGMIFIEDGNHIVIVDQELSSERILHESNDLVHCLYANSELVFFAEGNKVMRLHVPSGIIDVIFEHENIDFLMATTNTKIIWGFTNPEYLAYEGDSPLDEGIQQFVYFFFDSVTGASRSISYDEVRDGLHNITS